jgi:hypothetical protein
MSPVITAIILQISLVAMIIFSFHPSVTFVLRVAIGCVTFGVDAHFLFFKLAAKKKDISLIIND